MAKKSQSKQRSQGGGRKSNSEPRLQVFSQFAGCNFQLSPSDYVNGFTEKKDNDSDQSDLQMNYMVVQNNVKVSDNKTLESRQPIEKLFDAPEGCKFTGVGKLIDEYLYMGCDDDNLYYSDLADAGSSMSEKVDITDNNGNSYSSPRWTEIARLDDKLVALSSDLNEDTGNSGMIWTGAFGQHALKNAKKVPDPDALSFSQLKAMGTLSIGEEETDDLAFRVGIRYTRVNEFGPTNISKELTFYASAPTTEWHSGQYLLITGSEPSGYNIGAVELYYVEDTYSDPAFLGRVDLSGDGGAWQFAWTGYLFDTSMWTIANLTAPTQNYTTGVEATRMTSIDGRAYFWGGTSDNGQRLYIGGNPGNPLSISTGTGGGYADVDPGTGQQIRMVCKYKTQSGSSIVTMLCDAENSQHEWRYNLVENNVTLSTEQSMKGWQTEQVSGSVGCKSYHGAVVCEDGLYAISRYGLALTTLTMEYNSQIRVNYVSDAIKPAFTLQYGHQLSDAQVLYLDGVIYIAFGSDKDETLDNVLFCYDVGLKSWWTYTIDIDEDILSLIQIDHCDHDEGIGIVTPSAVYLLPTTEIGIDGLIDDDDVTKHDHFFVMETGELSTQQPMQGFQRLVQFEFRFDRFIGDMRIELIGVDQFGRKVSTVKHITHDTCQYNLTEWMRIDLTLQSYKLRFTGNATFRMTHFIGKVYTLSNRIGLVWGFDDSQTHNQAYDIHPTFRCYNDIRKAIIP